MNVGQATVEHGPAVTADADTAVARFRDRSASIGVIGLGYVGLPLMRAAAETGFRTIGFDIDRAKVDEINAGRSYIRHIASDGIEALRRMRRIDATDDFSRIAEVEAILICVPTPLTRQREPDLSFVVGTTEAIAPRLRRGQLVVLESTTYPGTTREVMRPILERTGLVSGRDFFLAYSPEREDPGNIGFGTADIPKVVGGDGPDAKRARLRPLRPDRRAHRPGLLAGGGRGGQAHGKHLPLGQHRSRQRAEGDLRGDGHRCLGSHRGRQDQAVRLHAVLPGSGARRPLHPDRPVLSDLEGARIRSFHPLCRAGRRDQHRDAASGGRQGDGRA